MSQGHDANYMWETSHGYQKGKLPSWMVYIIYGLLLLLFIWLYPIVMQEFFGPHPERPETGPPRIEDWP